MTDRGVAVAQAAHDLDAAGCDPGAPDIEAIRARGVRFDTRSEGHGLGLAIASLAVSQPSLSAPDR